MRRPLDIAAPSGWWHPEPPARGAAIGSDDAVAFGALLAFTFVLFLAPQTLVPALAPLRPAFVAAGMSVAALTLRRLADGEPLARPGRETLLAAALAGWALATAPLSYWPGGTVALLQEVYLKALVVFWLLPEVVTTPARLRTLCVALSLMTLPLATTAARNFAEGAYVAGVAERRILGYDAPLTQNPNDLALVLNLVLPLTVALACGARRPAARVVLATIAALQAGAVVLTFSRAGFLTLVAVALLSVARRLAAGDGRPAAAMLVLALGAAPFLPEGYASRVATIFDVEADATGSAQQRWTDTVAAVRFVAGHPILGAGAGMNTLALNEVRGPVWKEVHNVYLQYGVDLGLPGLVLFLLLLRSCAEAAAAARRSSLGRRRPRDRALLAEGIQVSLAAFCVAGFFHPVAYHFYFFLVGGLAVAAKVAAEAATGTPAEEAGAQ